MEERVDVVCRVTREERMSKKQLCKVANFIDSENRTSSGNITRISEKFLSSLETLSMYTAIAIFDRSIVGFALSIPLPIRTQEVQGTLKGSKHVTKLIGGRNCISVRGCTTFLCVREDMKGKGLAGMIIESVIKEGLARGVSTDYHLTAKKRSPNAVPVRTWIRPIDPKAARVAGFKFTTPGRSRYNRDNIVFKKKYLTDTKCILVTSDNAELHYEQALSLMRGKYCYYPTLEHWKVYTTVLDTYVVYSDATMVSWFSIYTNELVIGNRDPCTVKTVVLSAGNGMSLAKEAVNVSSDAVVLYFYEMGSMTSDSIRSVNGLSTNGENYFEMYNSKLVLDPSDIHVPLL